jgi:hypothetical protein
MIATRGALDGRVRTVDVSDKQIRYLDNLYSKNPTAQACKETLNSQLFAGEVHVARNGVKQSLKQDFQLFLDDRFGTFGRDAIDAIRKFGFAPCVMVADSDTGERVPAVPHIGTFSATMHIANDLGRHITIEHKDGTIEPNGTRTPIEASFVFVASFPTIDGDIVSQVATLARDIVRLDTLERAAVECDVNAARPTTFLQERNKNSLFGSREQGQAAATGMSEWFSQTNNTQEMQELKKRQEDHEVAQRVARQRDVANQRNAANMAAQNDPAAKPIGTSEGNGSLASSVMLIPAGLEVAPTKNVNPAQNIDREKANLVDTICGAMGVPNSLIHPASSTYNSGGLVQRIINAEMNKQAKYLKNIFTRAYKQAFLDAPKHADTKHKRKKTKRNKASADTRSGNHQPTAADAAQHATTCYLVFPPFLEVETLLAIAAQNIFKNEYIGTLLAQGAGFFEQGETEKFIVPQELAQQTTTEHARTNVDTQTNKHNKKAIEKATKSQQ